MCVCTGLLTDMVETWRLRVADPETAGWPCRTFECESTAGQMYALSARFLGRDWRHWVGGPVRAGRSTGTIGYWQVVCLQ